MAAKSNTRKDRPTQNDGDRTIPYDVRGVSPRPTLRRLATRTEDGESPRISFEPSSFEARVAAREVDLVKLVEEGLPPVEYLPASEGMLIRGKRHLIVAPFKTGK